MDLLLEALDTASAPDRGIYRPELFRLSLPTDRQRLDAVLKLVPGITIHDELRSQLVELVRTLDPSVKFGKEELRSAATAHLMGIDPHLYGVWVYYPWSRRLVHLLDEAEFAQVRTDRNRNKITSEEQSILATKKVGVIGLSVGQSVCLTMALERCFGELRIADFDTLELSNLNRIRSGTHAMGNLKTVNVAREIAEIDPFLKVVCFNEGITEANIDAFLVEGGKLDVLVEECDSVDVKILSRFKAKALGIPVVMDTSDRGMIDIERFDLEPERPIFHGKLEHLDLSKAKEAKTAEQKLQYVVPITGLDTLSKRMKGSMLEMGRTLTSWPQLASSVAAGGGFSGDVLRRLLLSELKASGRWFIDPASLINDPVEVGSDHEDTGMNRSPAPLTVEQMDKVISQLALQNVPSVPLSEELAAELAQAGSLAPSGGNDQPWRFHLVRGRLFMFHDVHRSFSLIDPTSVIAGISLGSAIENVSLKAAQIGLEQTITYSPLSAEPSLIAVFEFKQKGSGRRAEPDALYMQLADRCTNRRMGDGKAISDDGLNALRSSVIGSGFGVELHVHSDKKSIDAIADLCGKGERLRFMNPVCHHELFTKEVRWTAEEAIRTRDGLDLATFEMNEGEILGMKVASDPEAIALLRNWEGGSLFQDLSGPAIRSSSAIALISIGDKSQRSILEGGRAAQRLWLKATELGLGVHPISASVLLGLIEGKDAFNERELSLIEKLFCDTAEVFDLHGRFPLFMYRLFYAESPSVRSLRRPMNDVFSSGKPNFTYQ